MSEVLLQKALQAVQKGHRYAFATVVESTLKGTPRKAGAKMVVLEDGTSYGTIGGGRNEKDAIEQCLKAMASGQTNLITYDYFGEKGQSVCGGQIKVFIEPEMRKKHLIICGAGHIALPLSLLGKMLGLKITVIDDRKELANKERFPHADRIVTGAHARQLSCQKTDSDTFIMVVTQGNEYDYECLETALKTKASYIGVISSKAKKVKFLGRLKKKKISPKSLARISMPAGIDIGAQTPEEIALSIASEIVQSQNRAWMGTDKFKDKSKESARTDSA